MKMRAPITPLTGSAPADMSADAATGDTEEGAVAVKGAQHEEPAAENLIVIISPTPSAPS
jgi:hypothetical protein